MTADVVGLQLERLPYLAQMAAATASERDNTIRHLYDLGVPVPQIAAAAGLTRSRIYQVLRMDSPASQRRRSD